MRRYDLLSDECRKFMSTCCRCGKQMQFYIIDSFGGNMGLFKCSCGHEDMRESNLLYATQDDWDKFYENSGDIMY